MNKATKTDVMILAVKINLSLSTKYDLINIKVNSTHRHCLNHKKKKSNQRHWINHRYTHRKKKNFFLFFPLIPILSPCYVSVLLPLALMSRVFFSLSLPLWFVCVVFSLGNMARKSNCKHRYTYMCVTMARVT